MPRPKKIKTIAKDFRKSSCFGFAVASVLLVLGWKMNGRWANFTLLLAWGALAVAAFKAAGKSLRARILWSCATALVSGPAIYYFLWTGPEFSGSIIAGVLKSGKSKERLEVVIGNSGSKFHLTGTNSFDLLNTVFFPWRTLDIFTENRISARIEGNRLLVSCRLIDSSSSQIVEMQDNEWRVAPPPATWDKNFTKDTLEVLDKAGDVVLQVRLNKNRVHFQAKLFGSSGRSVAFVEPVPERLNQVILDPPRSLKIEKLFKYPSELHPGEQSSSIRTSLRLPDLRLTVWDSDIIQFHDGKLMSLMLVMPSGNTDLWLGLTNASDMLVTNIEVTLIPSHRFAVFKNTDTNKLVGVLTSTVQVPYMPPHSFNLIPLPLVISSLPEFEQGNESILVPAIGVRVSTPHQVTDFGFSVIFPKGVTNAYRVWINALLEGQSFNTPKDSYANPEKYFQRK
jgi:hypothetical protein